MVHLSWTKNFWLKTIFMTFSFLLVLFIVQNLKKFLWQIQNYNNALFLTQNGPFASIFFWKIVTIILIYLLVPFIVENLKKILPLDPELWECAFLAPKMAYFPNENCFRKPVHEPCFFYSCLSIRQKSKSDINLLLKYWWLKNTEISLTKSHFCL